MTKFKYNIKYEKKNSADSVFIIKKPIEILKGVMYQDLSLNVSSLGFYPSPQLSQNYFFSLNCFLISASLLSDGHVPVVNHRYGPYRGLFDREYCFCWLEITSINCLLMFC